MSPPLISALMTSTVAPSINDDLSAALTAANQMLNSLLFGDLPYSVKANDKDEPEFFNMKFDMDERGLVAISEAFVLHALIGGVQMFSKRVITGWHTYHKNKRLMRRELVNCLNACGSWYAKVNVLIEITTKYVSKRTNSRQEQPKWNMLGHSNTRVVICCY